MKILLLCKYIKVINAGFYDSYLFDLISLEKSLKKGLIIGDLKTIDFFD